MMTNYEKIKLMSIDEIADMLVVKLTNLLPVSLWQALPTGRTYLAKSEALQDVKEWLEDEAEPAYCTDKQNNLVHCEECHKKECK